MATPIPTASGGLSLADIMSMIKSGSDVFSGSKTTTSQTKGQTFDQDQMDSMLKSILEQTGGYADTAGAAHAAGGYDSSTQALALNDLLTRSAAKVAELNTTQTNTQTTETAPKIGSQGIQDTLGALAGAQLLSSGLGSIGQLLGIGSTTAGTTSLASKGADAVSKALGLSGNTMTGSSTVLADSTNPAASAAEAMTPYDLEGGLGTASTGGNGFFSSISDFSTGSPNSTAGTVGQGVGYAKAGYDAYNDLKTDNAGGAVGAGVGAYFGGPLGEMAGQAIGTAADTYVLDPINQAVIRPVGAAIDQNITQPIGSAASSVNNAVIKPITSAIGGAVKSAGNIVKKVCFAYGTLIRMADGKYKEIQDLRLDDEVYLGGRVTTTAITRSDEMYAYKGTVVSGSHCMFEEGGWVRVRDSAFSVPTGGPDLTLVYPVCTEHHLLVTPTFISADFAVDESPWGSTEKEILDRLNTNYVRNERLLIAEREL